MRWPRALPLCVLGLTWAAVAAAGQVPTAPDEMKYDTVCARVGPLPADHLEAEASLSALTELVLARDL